MFRWPWNICMHAWRENSFGHSFILSPHLFYVCVTSLAFLILGTRNFSLSLSPPTSFFYHPFLSRRWTPSLWLPWLLWLLLPPLSAALSALSFPLIFFLVCSLTLFCWFFWYFKGFPPSFPVIKVVLVVFEPFYVSHSFQLSPSPRFSSSFFCYFSVYRQFQSTFPLHYLYKKIPTCLHQVFTCACMHSWTFHFNISTILFLNPYI